MAERKFEVGEYVMLMRDAPDDNAALYAGDIGIVRIYSSSRRVGVNWLRPIGGHDLSGNLVEDESENGWYVDIEDLAPAGPQDSMEIQIEDLPDLSELF